MVGSAMPTPGTTAIKMRTGVVGVGTDGRYPYPATENWQKAIGAHSVWMEIDGEVEVTRDFEPVAPGEFGPPAPVYARRFDLSLTMHMEDMYNFNPGAADIVTGIPDDDNGKFELTGLGQQYLNTGTAGRSLSFNTGMDLATRATADDTTVGKDRSVDRRPADSRPYPGR